VDGEGGAIAEDGTHLHRWADVSQAVLLQTEVVVYRAHADQGVVVAVDVVEEAGFGQLLRGESAALLGTLLEDRDVPAALRQVRSQGHSIVAGPDNDGVIGGVRH
jgi:hypothetical protein